MAVLLPLPIPAAWRTGVTDQIRTSSNPQYTLELREERSGTDIAAASPEHIGHRRGQEEGSQNPGDEEIKEHGRVLLRSTDFSDEADDSRVVVRRLNQNCNTGKITIAT